MVMLFMRKLVLLISAVLITLATTSYSFGFATNGQDCSKCHTLKNDEVKGILKDFVPDMKVLDIKPGPLKGLWEVDFETGGKKSLIYVDFSKKYFVSGALISIKEKRNITQERYTELNKVDVAQIPLNDALVMGDKNAKHRIIVFDDPD